MALMKVRQVEELWKQMHKDPRETSVICAMHERLRIQHDQMMLFATEFNKLIDLTTEMIRKLGVRDDMLNKLGVEEMVKNMSSGVAAVDAQDDDPDDTQTRGRN